MTYRELQQNTSPTQREEYFKKHPEQVQGYNEYCQKEQTLGNEINKYNMFESSTEHKQALSEYIKYMKQVGNKELPKNTEDTDTNENIDNNSTEDTDTDENTNNIERQRTKSIKEDIQEQYNKLSEKYNNASFEERQNFAKSEEFNQLKKSMKENNITVKELRSNYKEHNVENTKTENIKANEGIDR